MSPTRLARLHSVVVFPILSPPIRVSLRSLQWLNRRPLPSSRPPSFLSSPSHCRALHLYKTAKAQTIHGQHKVIPFSLYEPPPPKDSNQRINLVDPKSSEVLHENITFEELYNDHLKDGLLLHQVDPVPKPYSGSIEMMQAEDIPNKHNNYALVKAKTLPGIKIRVDKPKIMNMENKYFKQLAMLKEVHVQLDSPAAFWRISLDRAYQFLEHACPVEVVIRISGKHTAAKDKLHPGPADRWPWMHNSFPHLRPDFWMKSMPKGTSYLVKPVSDGRVVQWVMSMPYEKSGNAIKDLTKRLFKVQTACKANIAKGQQPEMPMVLRFNLIQAGSTDYSLQSGAPKNSDAAHALLAKYEAVKAGEVAAERVKKFRGGMQTIEWGTESLESVTEKRRLRFRSDQKEFAHRYMIPPKAPEDLQTAATRRFLNRLPIAQAKVRKSQYDWRETKKEALSEFNVFNPDAFSLDSEQAPTPPPSSASLLKFKHWDPDHPLGPNPTQQTRQNSYKQKRGRTGPPQNLEENHMDQDQTRPPFNLKRYPIVRDDLSRPPYDPERDQMDPGLSRPQYDPEKDQMDRDRTRSRYNPERNQTDSGLSRPPYNPERNQMDRDQTRSSYNSGRNPFEENTFESRRSKWDQKKFENKRSEWDRKKPSDARRWEKRNTGRR
jgi:hypothetical protein